MSPPQCPSPTCPLPPVCLRRCRCCLRSLVSLNSLPVACAWFRCDSNARPRSFCCNVTRRCAVRCGVCRRGHHHDFRRRYGHCCDAHAAIIYLGVHRAIALRPPIPAPPPFTSRAPARLSPVRPSPVRLCPVRSLSAHNNNL